MKRKRFLSFLLIITLLLGNTMSVSATSSSVSVNGVEETTVEDIVEESAESTENMSEEDSAVESSEEASQEPETVESTEESSQESESEETTGDVESTESEEAAETEVGPEETATEEETTTEEFTEAAVMTVNGITGELPAPEEDSVYAIHPEFGEVELYWDYTQISQISTFHIYYSVDGGSTYEQGETNNMIWWDGNGLPASTDKETEFGCSIDIPLDATGNNAACIYKIVPVGTDGTESENFVTYEDNSNRFIGSPKEGCGYVGICFIDENGNEITELSLHVGETKQLGVALIKEDGTVVSADNLKDPDTSDFFFENERHWTTLTTESLDSFSASMSEDWSGTYVDWLLTEDVTEGMKAYFKANAQIPEGKYCFIDMRADCTEIFGWFALRLPVTILPAEEGVKYDEVSSYPVYETKEEAEQGFRDLLTARDNDTWIAVPYEMQELDEDVIWDMYAERDDMKPYEGDYLHFTMGDAKATSGFYTLYESTSFKYKGEYYYAHRSTMPFITTKAQEAEVDAAINALVHTKGGELYAYKDATDTEKIRAVYDYIRENVSGTVPGNRRTPIYHTAYHALIKGSGTCQAFAVLFTRLTRELGVASKVIMGTDAANHAYNIVEVGNQWYFIDSNNGRFLSNAKEFKRSQEQKYYLDQRYIDNYLSKIPGSAYYVETLGSAVVTDSTETIEETFEKLREARDYIITQAAVEGNESTTYTITITDGDMAMPADGLDFAEYANRVSLELGGNKLILRDGLDASMTVGYVNNGRISVGDDGTLTVGLAIEDDSTHVYENLDIIYESTLGDTLKTACLKLGSASNGKLLLKDSVSVDDEFWVTYVCGNTEVNTDITAKNIELGQDVSPDSEIVVNGSIPATNNCILWDGNISVESLTSKKAIRFHNMDTMQLTISDKLTLAGTVSWESFDSYEPVRVNLVRRFETESDTEPYGQAAINISAKLCNIVTDAATGAKVSLPMFHFSAANYVGDNLQENKTFSAVTSLGTFKGTGYNAASKKYVTITDSNLKEYATVELAEDTDMFAELDNNTLLVSCIAVTVTEASTNQTASFSSLKKAVAGLNTLAGKKSGTYTFEFVENAILASNITLPSFVKEAVFTAPEEKTLDFNSYKLTTPNNVTLDGSIVFEKANISAATLNIPYGNRSLSTVSVKTLNLADEQQAEVTIGTLKASAAIKVGAQDILRVQTASGIKNVELNPGALLIADKFTQTSSGKIYAWADSKLVINESATLYNPVLNALDANVTQPVHIYKTEEAKINLLGKLTRAAQQTLIFVGKLSQPVSTESGTANDIILEDYSAVTPLFDTKISKFPLDVVVAEQSAEDSTSEFNVIYKLGNTVYVGKKIIYASATTAAGVEMEKTGFAKWSDAIAYLNKAGKNAECVIEIVDDFETKENFTLPSKAKSLVIRGVSEEDINSVQILEEGLENDPGNAEQNSDRIQLTYLGDISLSSNTCIENLDLSAKKYNSKKKVYDDYASVLKLNGKALNLTDISVGLTSIAGNAKAALTLENTDITVKKAVTSLGYLYMSGSELLADNVTVTNTLTMNSSEIDCVTKMTLNHVISESADNVFAYGGNSSKNILTIKGNVSFTDDADETVTLLREEADETISEQVIIRKNAITLKVKTMEANGYVNGAVLCSAQKAGSSWFVVGSTWEIDEETGEPKRTITHGTYKKSKNILCGELVEKVNLYSSKSGEENSYVLEGGFTTLQDALSEVDRIAVKTNYYQIELMKADKGVVTFTNKGITFPSKTAGITVRADSSMEESLAEPKIYFKGDLILKSNTVFEEIAFAPVKNAKINLGNYSLTLSECYVDADNASVGFSQIAGSGVKKSSALILDDTSLHVLGNVTNIGTLAFSGTQADKSELISNGTVNVGGIELKKDAYLSGLATVTRKKVSGINTVTKIASKITINSDVISDNGSTLYLDLWEKSGKVYKQLDFDGTDMEIIEEKGIQLAKALVVTYPNVKALQRENASRLIKSGGYLIWYPAEHGAELEFFKADADTKTIIPCLTIADAVTEINNQKVKRDYVITLKEAINETSGVEPNGTSYIPKALKMPTSKYINSLVLQGEPGAEDIRLGYLSNITFTCNTTLSDINFVQMVKVKNIYKTMDEAKKEYPGIVTVNTGGYALDIEGIVTFNTPVTLNGKNNGILNLDEEGTIVTLTNQWDTKEENVIYGSITAFKELNVNQCNLTLKEYKASATSKTYKASNNKVTNLNLIGGNITVVGDKAKGSFTVSNNLYIDSGELIVGGKVSLKNATLEGGPSPTIHADTDFTISGTLISRSNNTTLETRLKGSGKAPYLLLKGNVVCEGAGPVYIGVYPHVNSLDKNIPVTLTGAPKVTAQLLTASKAPADVFQPIPENTSGCGKYDSETNPNGYWVGKVKSNVYVYEGK